METGSFGVVQEAYTAARQDFPQQVIDYIWQYTAAPEPVVLDLGCGTGIGTRQLAKCPGVSIIGCDVDQKMIEAAQKESANDITYCTAPAHSLPFASNEFDIVTAFSAFHWFRDKASLAEIRRVLKSNGIFFVINKNDTCGFRKGYREKLAKLLNTVLQSPKEKYNPTVILQEGGYIDVKSKVIASVEWFSFDEALRHIQSSAVWAKVPKHQEFEAIQLMSRPHFFRH